MENADMEERREERDDSLTYVSTKLDTDA